MVQACTIRLTVLEDAIRASDGEPALRLVRPLRELLHGR